MEECRVIGLPERQTLESRGSVRMIRDQRPKINILTGTRDGCRTGSSTRAPRKWRDCAGGGRTREARAPRDCDQHCREIKDQFSSIEMRWYQTSIVLLLNRLCNVFHDPLKGLCFDSTMILSCDGSKLLL